VDIEAVDRLGELRAALVVEVGDDHVRALSGEALRHGPPDAAGRTGDHRHLLLQAIGAHGAPRSVLGVGHLTPLSR
jgi:hypothetical protein